jgi:methyl-galactoside transport system substrate-binding protein
MKKIITALIAAYLCLSCSIQEKSAGLFIYNQKDPYVDIFASQIREQSEGLFIMEIFDCQNSQIIQNEFIEKQIKKKNDLMIINPVDRLGAYSIIKKLKSLDIPVIFFNREPLAEDLDLWEKAYYVGAMAEQSGRLQAEMIMDLYGGDFENLNKYDRNGNGLIEAVILKGEQGHQDAELRTSEVVKAFRENGFNLNILVTEVANWKRDEAYEKMKPVIDNFGSSMELVISNNDAMALGAVSKMRQSGMFRDTNGNGKIDKDDDVWLPVVGIDGLEEAVEMIDQGYLYGSVLNDSLAQAKAIAELSDVILNNKNPDAMKFPLVDGRYIWIDYKLLK